MKPLIWSTLALALAGIWSAPLDAAERLGDLSFEECDLKNRAIADVLGASCTWFEVPENPDAPDGRKIKLRLALVPARTADPASDPVFFLAGGPGQSALESYPSMVAGFERIREKRHILLLDQRGTGSSNKLVCEDDSKNGSFGEDLDTAEAQQAFASRCAERLSKKADPRYYTTTVAAADLDAVRRALGVEQINLVGGSYGTRMAQTYLRYYPKHVRRMILDGVVPPTLMLGNDHAKNLEAAVQGIFKRCREQAECYEAFGDPAADLARLRAELRLAPKSVRFRDPESDEWRDDTLSDGQLVASVRLLSYAPETAALLPKALHDAANGRSDVLRAQVELILGDLGEQIMHGMQLSVMCSEDVPGLVIDPADEDTLLGTSLITSTQAQCRGWPTGSRPNDFHQPLQSDVPTLLISGEFDPVTPPRYGEETAKGYSAGRHLMVKGRGHIVLNAGCMPRIAADFIEGTAAKDLDVACLDVMPVIPAFLNANGWGP